MGASKASQHLQEQDLAPHSPRKEPFIKKKAYGLKAKAREGTPELAHREMGKHFVDRFIFVYLATDENRQQKLLNMEDSVL